MNGAMAVIVDSSYYDLTMTASAVTSGNNFLTKDATVTVIPLKSDGTYDIPYQRFVTSVQTANTKIVKQVNKTDGKTIYKNVRALDGEPTLDTIITQSTPLGGVVPYTTYTAQQEITIASKNIQAYVPKQLGLIQSSFVTTKYN
jgi:hypothetical protein